ncbi:MAG: phosphotransferase [Planctomycetota bacterium]
MTPGRARFDAAELRSVLDAYDLDALGFGAPTSIKEVPLGSPQAPKAVIECAGGRLLLKRRAPARSEVASLRLAHRVQEACNSSGIGVALPFRERSGQRFVMTGDGACELFPWIDGRADDRGAGDAFQSGATLASFARASEGLGRDAPPPGLHRSPTVRTWLDGLSNALAEAYERCGEEAACDLAGSGFDRTAVVHGDWHPGNLLFEDRTPTRVAALLDFDGVAQGPVWFDAACGTLMASLPREPSSLAGDGPLRLDADRAIAFLRGLASALGPNAAGDRGWRAIAPLMIETLLAELAEPVAVTGSLGGLDGTAVLRALDRELPRLEAQCRALVGIVLNRSPGEPKIMA